MSFFQLPPELLLMRQTPPADAMEAAGKLVATRAEQVQLAWAMHEFSGQRIANEVAAGNLAFVPKTTTTSPGLQVQERVSMVSRINGDLEC